jgi:hypothetical protein
MAAIRGGDSEAWREREQGEEMGAGQHRERGLEGRVYELSASHPWA